MKFLFVDTETSGLSPAKGQIIELAGVLAELDPVNFKFTIVDEFEELIAFRSAELDERVTRITGIAKSDLEHAAALTKVQDNWANWLERWSKEEVRVVGHSIDFDLAFLKSESWFLPSNFVSIDTLDLVKVLLPEESAINLEYLVNRFGLSPQQKSDRKTGELVAHRALYDTLCCMYLFETLLHKLISLRATPEFYTQFKSLFHLSTLEIYGNGVTTEKAVPPLTLNKIGFDGQKIAPNIFQKINSLGTLKIEHTILELLTQNLPPRFQLNMLQLYVLNLVSSQGATGLKFHGREQVDFIFFDLILDIVLDLDSEHQTTELVLEQFETIVSHIRQLSEKQYKLGKLITLLEIYSILVPSDETVKKTISAYDFFLLTLQPFLQRSEYSYKPFEIKPEEQVIRAKIGQLSIQLQELFTVNWDLSSILTKEVVEHIQQQLQELKDENGEMFISANKQLNFRYYSHQLFVGQFIQGFRLNSLLQETIAKNPLITTYYSESDFWKFLEITGTKRVLEGYPHIKYMGENTELLLSLEEVELKKFFLNKIALSKNTNKPTLILCGQNSGLRDSEKVVISGDIEKHDFLILGDTGSLTKIASKISSGFKGLVIIKTGDFDYFARLGLIDYAEIWILCQPYFPIENYWWSLAKRADNRDEYLRIFKFMYLKGLASKIHAKTQLPVRYQKGYNLK
jgi:DNA polymerase III epsilon subunit-like protein